MKNTKSDLIADINVEELKENLKLLKASIQALIEENPGEVETADMFLMDLIELMEEELATIKSNKQIERRKQVKIAAYMTLLKELLDSLHGDEEFDDYEEDEFYFEEDFELAEDSEDYEPEIQAKAKKITPIKKSKKNEKVSKKRQ